MIIIRGDGNARIGAGHLMRCMAIAEELALLQDGREGVCFVCADEESGALARENGFHCYVTDTDYRDMESELPWWDRFWRERDGGQEAVVIVDSYYVTDRYLSALGSRAYTVLMDDLGARPYPVDCVVNYNAPADPESYRKMYQGRGTRLLIGSRYVPLRGQFRKTGGGRKPGQGPGEAVREVLVTAGGGDSENIAGKILERLYRTDLSFHLVIGRFHPDFDKMQELEKEYENIHIHHDVKDMAGLMSRCQVALTAGGSTVYELAALGVPFICFSYAENQEALVEYIGEKHIAGSAGAWHKDPAKTMERIEKLFEEMTGCPGLRDRCRKRETEMTDGEGAVRLAREIAQLR